MRDLDLYGILGLHRDADIRQVRSAYRKWAKATHPDTGGSVEKFALVKLAYDTLSDDARRAHYDATGEAEEPKVEQSLQNAMELAFQTMCSVLQTAESRGLGEDFELIGDSIKTLELKLQDIAKTQKRFDVEIAKIRRVRKRLTAKKGKTELLPQMFDHAVAQAERHKELAGTDRPKIERAILILKDHEYRFTHEPAASQPSQGFTLGGGMPKWFLNDVI
jgi:curved DNA-binding protein CbpA